MKIIHVKRMQDYVLTDAEIAAIVREVAAEHPSAFQVEPVDGGVAVFVTADDYYTWQQISTTGGLMMNTKCDDTQVISLNNVDMESFEAGYKDAYRKIMDLEAAGQTGYKIEILFHRNGEWAGHAWENNCGYSESDLRANGNFRIADIDLELELGLRATLEAWRDDLTEAYN